MYFNQLFVYRGIDRYSGIDYRGNSENFGTIWLFPKDSKGFQGFLAPVYLIFHQTFFTFSSGAQRVSEGSKSIGFQVPSVELRGFPGTLKPSHIRPCIVPQTACIRYHPNSSKKTKNSSGLSWI